MNYAIVGGGIAAVSALKAIREYTRRGEITVVSEEEHCFYYRPMTPLVIAGDKERDDLMHEREQIGDINLVHGRAVSLDPVKKEVTVADGRKIGYDRLLIATGSSPKLPDIPGTGERNVHCLRTMKDALALYDAAEKGRKAVILGGGYVGIKMAEALIHRGMEVTVVEQEDHILLPRLDKPGAALVEKKLAAGGVRLIFRETVAAINPGAKGVKLASGRELEADFVCIAVGVRPNIDWLQDSGIETDKALVVDDRLQTSLEGVYAAGDVVQMRDVVTGKTVVSALWSNAVAMGRAAGANMAGGKIKFSGGLEVLNAAEVEGIPIISVGNVLADPHDGYEIFTKQRPPDYAKLVFKDDVLAGMILMGDIENAGIYTALIKSGRPLGPLKAKAINRSLNYADFCTAAHAGIS